VVTFTTKRNWSHYCFICCLTITSNLLTKYSLRVTPKCIQQLQLFCQFWQNFTQWEIPVLAILIYQLLKIQILKIKMADSLHLKSVLKTVKCDISTTTGLILMEFWKPWLLFSPNETVFLKADNTRVFNAPHCEKFVEIGVACIRRLACTLNIGPLCQIIYYNCNLWNDWL